MHVTLTASMWRDTDRDVGDDVCRLDAVCILDGGTIELTVRRNRSLVWLREREQVEAVFGCVVLDDFADIVDRQEEVLLRVLAQRRVERIRIGGRQQTLEIPARNTGNMAAITRTGIAIRHVLVTTNLTVFIFNKIAIQGKGPDGKWIRKLLFYRESNIFNLCVIHPPEICVKLVFKHIHAVSNYTICR